MNWLDSNKFRLPRPAWMGYAMMCALHDAAGERMATEIALVNLLGACIDERSRVQA